jgi:CBS domain-containing protein
MKSSPPTQRSTVEDWMTENLVVIAPGEPLFAALERMAEEAIRHVIVVDEGRLQGIVSNRDVVRATLGNAEHRLELHTVKVEQVMTPTPLATVELTTPIEEAALLMVDRRVNALPVLTAGLPVGILTSDDLLRALALRANCPARPDL